VTLYLLDTDTDQNHPAERDICASVYTGTEEALLKQQLILGIGGVKLLHTLGIHPALYHVNEGRPAFLHWQLIRSYMDEHGMTYDQAHQLATTKTVYTNHTLVGGGRQGVNTDLLRAYSRYYADKMAISIDELLKPGMVDGQFDLTTFALNTSVKVSAVSQPHFRLCQAAWPQHNWVGITNGVHFPTWQSQDLASVVHHPAQLWQVHQHAKQQTADFIQQRTGFSYDPHRLVISWARRITGYKQLDSLFADIARLKTLVSVKNREIQLLVAGKAHAYDNTSKDLIHRIIAHFQTELAGFALFVPNYDLDVARAMVQGSDVWLNTPQYGLEASGTSGMKAASNGVLQCTVADGWAAEVAWQNLGWALNPDSVTTSFYETLEQEIAPLFWDRNEAGVPLGWMTRMQHTIAMSRQYSASRMMREYQANLYSAV
jgi:starch phosphorylase